MEHCQTMLKGQASLVSVEFSFLCKRVEIPANNITPTTSTAKSRISQFLPGTNNWWNSSEAAYRIPMITVIR